MHALCEAAVTELAESGYASLTVRNVARRASVAPATAYTYFASREHLVAEVFWRRVSALGNQSVDRRRSAARRATDALLASALVVADETELAAASTAALLADDGEVAELRIRIGTMLRRRLVAAVPEASEAELRTLELVLSGALIQVGTGHLSYAELPRVLADAAESILRASPSRPPTTEESA